LKLITFRISGAFATFRDPSVTTNQTVYYIPSKSAVVGILGAMIGVNRSDTLGEIYGEEYQKFFKNTKIGIQFESIPNKVSFFTNHRSLKEPKTKPFKTEVLENPRYTIYVSTDDESSKKLSTALKKNEFKFSPYLGHAYCPATISEFKEVDAEKVSNTTGKMTKCVVLDESETYNPNFKFKWEATKEGSVIIERHIHHYFKDEKFDGRVLKHWIPTENSVFEIKTNSKRDLSDFYKIGEYVVCIY